jgi:hypothetical protein
LKHDFAQKIRGAKVAVGEIWFKNWGDNADNAILPKNKISLQKITLYRKLKRR